MYKSTPKSHTHCQASPAYAKTQAWQREGLPQSDKTTEKRADEKEARLPNVTYAQQRVRAS